MARAAKNKRNNNKLVAVEGAGVVLGTDPDLIQAESKSGESKDDTYDSKGNDDNDYDAKSSHK